MHFFNFNNNNNNNNNGLRSGEGIKFLPLLGYVMRIHNLSMLKTIGER